jgi:hypothetical protein
MVAVFTSAYTHGRHRMVAVITSAYTHGRPRMVAVFTSAYAHGRHRMVSFNNMSVISLYSQFYWQRMMEYQEKTTAL